MLNLPLVVPHLFSLPVPVLALVAPKRQRQPALALPLDGTVSRHVLQRRQQSRCRRDLPVLPARFFLSDAKARHLPSARRLNRSLPISVPSAAGDGAYSTGAGHGVSRSTPGGLSAMQRQPQPDAVNHRMPLAGDDQPIVFDCWPSPAPRRPGWAPTLSGGPGRAIDGMERSSLAPPGPSSGDSDGRSISARIWDFYSRLPEANTSVLFVDPSRSDAPTLFDEPELRAVLRFLVTVGGSGLTQAGMMGFADAVLPLEAAIAVPGGPRGLMTERFSSPCAFGAAVQTEHDRVLARRRWQVAHIFIGGVSYPVYFRDVLDAVLDRLRMSDDIVLEGTELPRTGSGERCRSHTMDSDLFFEE